MFVGLARAANGRTSQRLHGTRANGVDPNAFRAQIVRQIPDSRFQSRFRNTHNVVEWRDPV